MIRDEVNRQGAIDDHPLISRFTTTRVNCTRCNPPKKKLIKRDRELVIISSCMGIVGIPDLRLVGWKRNSEIAGAI
ncbi:MAG: hypothetical protein KBH99_10125 [Syntrophobacteraceae bacterium]|nr:hypothetical protein [Syntrophobacteraceae bacterium]